MNRLDWREWPVHTQFAAAALALSILVALTSTWRAFRNDTVPDDVLRAASAAPRIIINIPDDAGALRDAANRSPFDITPPSNATQLTSSVVQQNAPPLVRPRLAGTAIDPQSGSFVVVETPEGRIQLVRIGERTGELRLRSVSVGEAVFDDVRGNRITLKASRPGSDQP